MVIIAGQHIGPHRRNGAVKDQQAMVTMGADLAPRQLRRAQVCAWHEGARIIAWRGGTVLIGQPTT